MEMKQGKPNDKHKNIILITLHTCFKCHLTPPHVMGFASNISSGAGNFWTLLESWHLP